MEQSPARDRFVAAEHRTSAEGICRQNEVDYLAAHDEEQLRSGIDRLMVHDGPRPILLEVFTDAAADTRVFRDYYHSLAR
ncbi:MAG: hypothetical protein IJ710_10190 [Prevotella sp.]|nr:hypothetical protein [Prevotella sp.]